MRHVAGIFSRYLKNKQLYIDHISNCNYVIEACSKIVCHAMVNFAIIVCENSKSADRVYFTSLCNVAGKQLLSVSLRLKPRVCCC